MRQLKNFLLFCILAILYAGSSGWAQTTLTAPTPLTNFNLVSGVVSGTNYTLTFHVSGSDATRYLLLHNEADVNALFNEQAGEAVYFNTTSNSTPENGATADWFGCRKIEVMQSVLPVYPGKIGAEGGGGSIVAPTTSSIAINYIYLSSAKNPTTNEITFTVPNSNYIESDIYYLVPVNYNFISNYFSNNADLAYFKLGDAYKPTVAPTFDVSASKFNGNIDVYKNGSIQTIGTTNTRIYQYTAATGAPTTTPEFSTFMKVMLGRLRLTIQKSA